jgi:hypothetical protein
MLPFSPLTHGRQPPPNLMQRLGTGKRDYGAPSGGFSLPAGAQSGDLLFIFGTTCSGAAGPFTSRGGGVYRLLVGGDLIASLSLDGPGVWALYRGLFTVAVVSQISAPGGSSPAIPGFTKSPNCAGLIFAAWTNASATAGPTVRAPFTQLHSINTGGIGVFMGFGDLEDPAAYVDGTGVPMGISSNGSTTGYILEARF